MKNFKFVFQMILLCVLLINGAFISAEKISELSDILKPEDIVVYGDKIYITEGSRVNILDKTSGKLLKTFGKKGEGPQEFKMDPMIRSTGKGLIINSSEKVLFFTYDGKFQREVKVQGHNSKYLSLGKGFVGRKNKPEKKGGKFNQIIGLYDNDFKLIKELYSGKMPGMSFFSNDQNQKIPWPLVKEYVDYEITGDFLIIGDSSKGFYFKIFDQKGQLVKEINLDYNRIEIDQKFKTDAIARQESLSWFKTFKNRVKYIFPKHFPAYQKFFVADGKIYVQTHKKKGGLNEMIILDLKAKELGRAYVPGLNGAVQGGKYYHLNENEEEEVWELKCEDLKI